MSDYDMTADYIESDQPPRTIFAVASGEYSDYQIHFMCESEADAKEIASKLAKRPYSDGYVIESYPMFPQGAELKRKSPTLGAMGAANWWPTPNARDHKGAPGAGSRARGGRSSSLPASVKETDGSGRLNPAFLEWLMGFPIGWTELRHSETPSSRKSLNGSEEES